MASHSIGIPARLKSLLPEQGLTGTTVLVIGDLMLDRYIIGQAHRISPEAPVPVVTVSQKKVAAGGAGNVALNLAGLGVKTVVAGVTGVDETGTILKKVLRESGVDIAGIVSDDSRPTTCKSRVMSMSHQLVRFDEEATTELGDPISHALQRHIAGILNTGIHAVILSDYAKGVLTASLTASTIEQCLRRGIPVFVDPKRSDYSIYSRATCLTPNLKEFQTAVQAMGIDNHSFLATAQLLREKLQCPMLLVTEGNQGMTLVTAGRTDHFPAIAEEVFDVSGAGDTVIATFTAAIAARLDPLAAVELANIAASIVVRKVGTAPILWDELCTARNTSDTSGPYFVTGTE